MRTKIIATSIVALLLAGTAWAGEHPEPTKANAERTTAGSMGKGALDGKVFVGMMGKEGDAKGDKDEVSFKKGRFLSAACVQFGFGDAAYTVVEKNGVLSFTASPKNASGETMSWTGTVRDGVLEAKAVHKTASGETAYWFKGKLSADEPASKGSEHPEHPKSEHPEHPR